MIQFLVTVAPAARHGSVAGLRGTVDVRRGRRLCNDNNHLRITYDSLRSDLAKVDVHVIQPHEYDQLLELTDEMMARAVFKRGGQARCIVEQVGSARWAAWPHRSTCFGPCSRLCDDEAAK